MEQTTSWRVQVTDTSGKVWSSGVRLAGKDEAMCYMGNALYDFRDREYSIVEVKAIECPGEVPNVRVQPAREALGEDERALATQFGSTTAPAISSSGTRTRQ